LAEQVQQREPGSAADAAAAPTLSRYTRRPPAGPDADAAGAEAGLEAEAGSKAEAGGEPQAATAQASADDGIEISAPSAELPLAPEIDAAPAEASEESALAQPAQALDEREPAGDTPGGDPPAAEPVRRVEASEVQDAPSDPGWSAPVVPARTEPGPDHAPGGKKLPFWKRITLPRAPGPQPAARTEAARPPSLEPVLARLNALEKQLAANQAATENQLTRFEENITRLWELEEQMTLTEVRERLALLEANQEEIADSLHTVGRNLAWLAVVLAAFLAGALAGLSLLL